MRLDHLLSKEEEVRVLYTVELLREPAQDGRKEGAVEGRLDNWGEVVTR